MSYAVTVIERLVFVWFVVLASEDVVAGDGFNQSTPSTSYLITPHATTIKNYILRRDVSTVVNSQQTPETSPQEFVELVAATKDIPVVALQPTNKTDPTIPLAVEGLTTLPTTETAHTTAEVLPVKESKACPPLVGNYDALTQNQFSSVLTNDCRYDKLTKPFTDGPLNVTVQLNIRHIEAVDQLQFKMHMLVQYKYVDHRLNYQKMSPGRDMMLGEDLLRGKIWIPHVILSNERDTSIMGLEGKDVFVSILPLGEVIFSYRMTATIYCWMDLKKFPFDEQICDLHFISWTYNASSIMLVWDENAPVKVTSQLHLTEYSLRKQWTESRLEEQESKGAFVGKYSVLIFKFKLSREVGYYIMDYFVPSIMLVCTSWVTFWLQADNAAPRVTLGTSTMLSFITLASVQSKTLPKVSYIKASEIWFLGCSMFIFASMVEFAFVNIIWRRSKEVELIKVNSKYILKSAITPKLARKELQRSSSMNNLHKSRSCSSLDVSSNKKANNKPIYDNYLTVHSFNNIPIITTESEDDLVTGSKENCGNSAIPLGDNVQNSAMTQKWTTMTPQEIAIWIDKRSRIIFPCAFLVFNIFYWTFVYIL